jgi:hypothetical protein
MELAKAGGRAIALADLNRSVEEVAAAIRDAPALSVMCPP